MATYFIASTFVDGQRNKKSSKGRFNEICCVVRTDKIRYSGQNSWHLAFVKGYNICLNVIVHSFTDKQYLSYSWRENYRT